MSDDRPQQWGRIDNLGPARGAWEWIMNAEKILYATDFSPASDAALGFASSLASDSGAVLHIVHVGVSHADAFATTAPYGYAISEEVEARERRDREMKLDRIHPAVAGVACEHHSLEGNPAEEVLRFAEEQGVDLIVVGSHGRTGLSRMLMGSVAEEIVRRADCPVLVVKHPASLTENHK